MKRTTLFKLALSFKNAKAFLRPDRSSDRASTKCSANVQKRDGCMLKKRTRSITRTIGILKRFIINLLRISFQRRVDDAEDSQLGSARL